MNVVAPAMPMAVTAVKAYIAPAVLRRRALEFEAEAQK
jgi:hypothetical protein